MSYFSIPTDSTKTYAAVKPIKDTEYSLTQLTPSTSNVTLPMYIQYINLTLKWSAAAYVSQNINIYVSYTKVKFSFSYTLFPSQKYTYTVNTTTYTTYNVYLGRNKFPLPNELLPKYNIGGIYADPNNIPTIIIQFTDPPLLPPPPPSTPTLSIYAASTQLQNSYFYVKPSDICNLPVPIGGSPSNERRVCYLDTIVNGVLTQDEIQNKQIDLQEAKKKQILKSKNRAYFSTSILYSRTVLNRSRWCG